MCKNKILSIATGHHLRFATGRPESDAITSPDRNPRFRAPALATYLLPMDMPERCHGRLAPVRKEWV